MRVKHIDWDDNNIQHILKHDVLPEEVEEIFDSNPYIRRGRKENIFGLRLNRFWAVFVGSFQISWSRDSKSNHYKRHDYERKEVL